MTKENKNTTYGAKVLAVIMSLIMMIGMALPTSAGSVGEVVNDSKAKHFQKANGDWSKMGHQTIVAYRDNGNGTVTLFLGKEKYMGMTGYINSLKVDGREYYMPKKQTVLTSDGEKFDVLGTATIPTHNGVVRNVDVKIKVPIVHVKVSNATLYVPGK